MKNIILASKSLARKQILQSAGINFISIAADIDEKKIMKKLITEKIKTQKAAIILAKEKALKISKNNIDDYVLAADQILDCDDKWFTKPKNIKDAKQQLLTLRGKKHKLVNGIVITKNNVCLFEYFDIVELKMRDFSDDFLNYYIKFEKDKIINCVGSYRLEGLGIQLFSEITGSYFSVLGLPILPVLEFLRKKEVLKK